MGVFASKAGTPFYFLYASLPVMSELLRSLPEYTRSQLALRNGQDKIQVWIAFQGIIYDVTGSSLWRTGTHYEHWAGQDLTEELEDAPHGAWVFEGFEAVGKLR